MAVLYGALSLKDLAAQRVTEVGVGTVDDSIQQSLTEHNRQLDAIMSLFADSTTDFKTRFFSNTGHRLQPGDEKGRALPVKSVFSYDLAFPLQMGLDAYSLDWVTMEKITVQELARQTNAILDADTNWMRDHLLAALFYKSSTNPWTFPDKLKGDLSVYGLANGDTQVYQIAEGASAGATDDHLITDASLDEDTYVNIYNDLTEHPENQGEVITFIPTNLRAGTEGLTGFREIEDMDVRPATSRDVLIGSLDTPVPGTVIGKIERQWVVEWKSLPSNYLLSVMTGGDKALMMREDPEESLRGFKEVADRNDHPWYEKQFARRAGFGAWNRVGAMVTFIDAGAYAIPTGYSSPLP